jgi:acetyl esterase/lipase
VMGHSAGAHIAALLAFDRRYGAVRDIAGFVGIAGPYDFLPFSATVGEVFAGARDPAVTQPITFAGAGAPPTLLLHGTADRTVYPRNSERLAAKLEAAGAPVRLVLYPNLGHVDIMLGLSSVFAGDGRMMDEILRFLTSSPRST